MSWMKGPIFSILKILVYGRTILKFMITISYTSAKESISEENVGARKNSLSKIETKLISWRTFM